MLLAVDIGNTNITLGVFDKDCLVETFRINSDINVDYNSVLDSLLKNYRIDSCAIVSVVQELTQVVKSACDMTFGVDSFLFSVDNTDLKIVLEEPNKIGADRLVNACAARNYKLPAIVVDVGTAITFDIVSKDKEFLGGVIMPGLNLQLRALNQYTSKLPLVPAGESESAVGNNTENAILSGVIRGTACAVEGLIKQCEDELGGCAAIIATGGQCSLIAEYMTRKFDVINPDLTLEGLRSAYLNSHVNLY
ncbi:MAG: type III pantothenate kinase [Candidatus Gastranaerophilales bacterium]|nr:type III pantothenate kinase [Candidatus Gastranaerophilales bacterium]MCM1073479.1 type III pantothenate kinase [Bacteroides sp.]